MKPASTPNGFTLIELMITVAVIGILAAIAYPSYTEYLRRGARADVKAVLLDNAQFMERNFTEANRYDQTSAGVAVTLPVTQSPRDGSPYYSIVLSAVTTTTYTLTATPTTGSLMDGDDCGSFTLNQLGQKSLTGASASVADCWNR